MNENNQAKAPKTLSADEIEDLLTHLDYMYDAYRDRHDGQHESGDINTHYAYRGIRAILKKKKRASRRTE